MSQVMQQQELTNLSGASGASKGNIYGNVDADVVGGDIETLLRCATSATERRNPLLEKSRERFSTCASKIADNCVAFDPLAGWSALEKSLVIWAGAHWPEPLDAIWNRLTDGDYVRRCFGSIFRRCCYADPSWLWQVIEWNASHVIRLSPFIGELDAARMGGLQIPGRMGWQAWIAAAAQANVIAWAIARGDVGFPPILKSSEAVKPSKLAASPTPELFRASA
jgi:hypothetical protein